MNRIDYKELMKGPVPTTSVSSKYGIMGVDSTDHFYVENLDVGSWGVKNDV